MRFCVNCGAGIKDEAVFCPKCGNVVDREDTNVQITITDAPRVGSKEDVMEPERIDTAASSSSPEAQQLQLSLKDKLNKRFGGVFGFLLCIVIVLLFIWIMGLIKGTSDNDEPVKYAPNQLPAPQEQVR